MQWLTKYYPVTGKVALFFVFILFINLIVADMAYGYIQLWSVWPSLLSGFIFGRWAERLMVLDFFVNTAKTLEDVRKGLQ